MFIQTETTPDAARLKFLPGREVLAHGGIDLRDKAQAASSPLAERLFAIPGVSGVAFGKESITVTKADGDWQHLKPAILGAIMEHFLSGEPLMRNDCGAANASFPPPARGDDDGTVGQIRQALRRVIDPELGYDIVGLGLIYDVTLKPGGTAHIILTTTTPGCPATNYLKQGAGDATSSVPGIERVEVELTHEPRWTPEMMSPEAKAHFGISDGGHR
jgi:metal-sulfur cluster biosynthetic enzyme